MDRNRLAALKKPNLKKSNPEEGKTPEQHLKKSNPEEGKTPEQPISQDTKRALEQYQVIIKGWTKETLDSLREKEPPFATLTSTSQIYLESILKKLRALQTKDKNFSDDDLRNLQDAFANILLNIKHYREACDTCKKAAGLGASAQRLTNDAENKKKEVLTYLETETIKSYQKLITKMATRTSTLQAAAVIDEESQFAAFKNSALQEAGFQALKFTSDDLEITDDNFIKSGALQEKIKALLPAEAESFFEQAREQGNIKIAYKLAEQVVAKSTTQEKDALWRGLFDHILQKIEELPDGEFVPIYQDIARKIFVSKLSSNELGKWYESVNNKPEFLEQALKEKLPYIPKVQSLVQLDIQINYQLEKGDEAKDNLRKLFEYDYLLKTYGNETINQTKLLTYLTKNYLIQMAPGNKLSTHALEDLTTQITRFKTDEIAFESKGDLTNVNEEHDTNLQELKNNALQKLKDEMKKILVELGVEAKDSLFQSTEKVIDKVPVSPTSSNDRITFRSLGHNASMVRPVITEDKNGSGSKLTNLLGKSAAGSDNDLANLVFSIDKIDKMSSQASQLEYTQTLLHILCSNKKASAAKLKETIEKLFDTMSKENYSYQIDPLNPHIKLSGNDAIENFLFRQDKDGNTALHLLVKNNHFKDEDLQSLIATLYNEAKKVTNKNLLAALNSEKESILFQLCSRDDAPLDAIKYICGDEVNGQKVDCAEDINYAPAYGDKVGLTAHYLAVINMFQDPENRKKEYIVQYLESKGANQNAEQTYIEDLQKNAAEYKKTRYEALGVRSIEALRDALKKKSKSLEQLVDENNTQDILKTAADDPLLMNMLAQNHNLLCYALEKGNIDLAKRFINNNIHLYGQDGDQKTPLEIANQIGDSNIVKMLLEKYNEHSQDELPKFTENAYTKSFVQATAALGAYLAQLPISKNNVAQQTVAGLVAAAGGAAAGLLAWGAGRLGYEAYQALSNKDDAYITRNFTKGLQALRELETKSTETIELSNIQKLEDEVIQEGKKMSPNLDTMHQTLKQAHILREHIFRPTTNKNNIIEQSKQLMENFKSWALIQQGRGASEGYIESRNNVLASAAGVVAGSLGTIAFNNPVLGITMAANAAPVIVKCLPNNKKPQHNNTK